MQPLHASAVAFDGRGLLITGASSSGKSTLALQLVALGAVLVADDRVHLSARDEELWLAAPEPLKDRIEARGIGILTSPTSPARAHAVVDLNTVETARFPERRTLTLEGIDLPLLGKVESPAFPAMLRAYVIGGPAP